MSFIVEFLKGKGGRHHLLLFFEIVSRTSFQLLLNDVSSDTTSQKLPPEVFYQKSSS